MKKVFIIHENTKPIKIGERYIQLATDYVCCDGYVREGDDSNSTLSFEDVYMYEDTKGQPNVELDNFLKGIWFETYEEGCKVLTKILHTRTMNDNTILGTYNKLVEKYPEAII